MTSFEQQPRGVAKENEDDAEFRHGRNRHQGFTVGQYIQSSPLFFTADRHTLPLADTYRGRSCVFVGSGPSLLKTVAKYAEQLNAPGVITLGVNNSPRILRPKLWTCVDPVTSFMKSIWLDPAIQKFVPLSHQNKKLLDNDSAEDPINKPETFKELNIQVRDCPNVAYYERNTRFRADQFFTEDCINWGSSKDNGGSRSVMYAAFRIMQVLGFRRIFLIGVDAFMSKESKYAFAQDRHDGSINGNNDTYNRMEGRFAELLPYMEEMGMEVYNCSPGSKLKVFPKMHLDEALKLIQQEEMLGIDYANENTEGLYDRKKKLEDRQKAQQNKEQQSRRAAEARIAMQNYTDEERKEVKQRLDQSRAALDNAKALRDEHHERRPDHEEYPEGDPVLLAWAEENDRLEADVHTKRRHFRVIEDEKRYKHGEAIKHGLWTPPPLDNAEKMERDKNLQAAAIRSRKLQQTQSAPPPSKEVVEEVVASPVPQPTESVESKAQPDAVALIKNLDPDVLKNALVQAMGG